MAYVLKVADCDSFVESFVVDSHYDDKLMHVFYTDNPKDALTYDNINEAIFHVAFIRSNLPSTYLAEEFIVIYEDNYKEL